MLIDGVALGIEKHVDGILESSSFRDVTLFAHYLLGGGCVLGKAHEQNTIHERDCSQKERTHMCIPVLGSGILKHGDDRFRRLDTLSARIILHSQGEQSGISVLERRQLKKEDDVLFTSGGNHFRDANDLSR